MVEGDGSGLGPFAECLPTAELVFVEFHVDAFSAELYTLDAEAEALFRCRFAS
jgi:hypothetical protein